jgi:hypothetical protein
VVRALTAALAAAMILGGCGSRHQPAGDTTSAAAAASAVRHALTATRDRSYHETFTEIVSVDASRLPSALAARLTAISGTIEGTADVANTKNFHIVVSLHGARVYVRSVNGTLSVSQDGVNYQPAPATTARQFSQLVSLVPGIVGKARDARYAGTTRIGSQVVSRYSATIPGNAVAPVFSALSVNFGSPGPLKFTIYVSRSSGLPVRVTDEEPSSFNLDKLHRPGVTGSFSVTVSGVRNFTYR